MSIAMILNSRPGTRALAEHAAQHAHDRLANTHPLPDSAHPPSSPLAHLPVLSGLRWRRRGKGLSAPCVLAGCGLRQSSSNGSSSQGPVGNFAVRVLCCVEVLARRSRHMLFGGGTSPFLCLCQLRPTHIVAT